MASYMQEFCVKKKDLVEVVSMIGLFGMLVSVCEMYPFSSNKIGRLHNCLYDIKFSSTYENDY